MSFMAVRSTVLGSGLFVLLLAALIISGSAMSPAQAADKVSVRINAGFQTRASYTGKGGLFTPSYSVMPCGTPANSEVDINEFTVKIRKGDKVLKTTHRPFTLVRLQPGRYRLHTKLRYTYRGKTTTKTKKQTVTITRKTDATSVSAAEYKRIRKGMSLSAVRRVIGGKGHYEYGYLVMDALQFEHSVGVLFEGGRVSDKWKDRNVYDWC